MIFEIQKPANAITIADIASVTGMQIADGGENKNVSTVDYTAHRRGKITGYRDWLFVQPAGSEIIFSGTHDCEVISKDGVKFEVGYGH